MYHYCYIVVTLCVAGCAAAGCDQEVDEGSVDGGRADAVVSGDRGNNDALAGDAVALDAMIGKAIKVTHAGKAVLVSLNKPKPVTFEGTPHAKLSDLVSLAVPSKTHAALQADFEAGDGFRSSAKSTCNGLVPVAGTLFAKGYVDINTRKLRWDTALKYPGCLYVKDLAVVLLKDK